MNNTAATSADIDFTDYGAIPPSLGEWSLENLSRPAETFYGHIKNTNNADQWDLTAPYQRQSVWSDEQRRNLIKSMIMGLPIGTVIISKLPPNRELSYRIVDGKQRIETIQQFAGNKFSVPGWWFAARALIDGEQARPRNVFYRDLTGFGQRSIDFATLPSLEFDVTRVWNPATREAESTPETGWVAREAELFLLVNFGGVDQTDADRARAVNVAQGQPKETPR